MPPPFTTGNSDRSNTNRAVGIETKGKIGSSTQEILTELQEHRQLAALMS